MATGVAAHEFPLPAEAARDADSEVQAIGAWLAKRTRPLERGDKSTMFKAFRAQLEAQGCSFKAPNRNFIKVYRQTAGGTLSARMGCPRANFNVGVQEVKRVREILKLDETHGVDSGAFYEQDLDAVVDGFLNTYRQVLDRLALT